MRGEDLIMAKPSNPLAFPSEHQPELLPCPFCHGEALIYGRYIGKKWYIGCSNCKSRTFYSSLKEYAITIWNTRYQQKGNK